MVKQRFEDFWKTDKSIIEDIFFSRSVGHTLTYIFKEVGFIGERCEGMYITGDYNCRTGGMAFNFYLKGVGAVRRFCLGGLRHGNAGHYHEHILQKDSDAYPANNLPFAIARNDLKGLEPEVAWRTICLEAKITHTGIFKDPTEWCP
jgi:hypothetical protein